MVLNHRARTNTATALRANRRHFLVRRKHYFVVVDYFPSSLFRLSLHCLIMCSTWLPDTHYQKRKAILPRTLVIALQPPVIPRYLFIGGHPAALPNAYSFFPCHQSVTYIHTLCMKTISSNQSLIATKCWLWTNEKTQNKLSLVRNHRVDSYIFFPKPFDFFYHRCESSPMLT